MKLVYCVVFFVAVLQATAVENEDEQNAFPDYWQDDYDNFYDYGDVNNNGSNEKKDDADKKVETDIQDLMEQNDEANESFSNEEIDALQDYQFEDNRSNNDNKENDNVEGDSQKLDEEPKLSLDQSAAEPEPETNAKEGNEDKNTDLLDEWWNEPSKDKDAPISEEVQEAVKEENRQSKDETYVKSVNEGNIDPDLDQIIEEIKKRQPASNELDSNDDENKNSNENDSGINYDDDTPEKVLDDLSDDLDQLLITLDKLRDNDSDLAENGDFVDNGEDVDDVQDYEEKYNRPYREGYIMALRDDYDNFVNSKLTDTSVENTDNSPNKTKLDEDIAQLESAELEQVNELVGTTKHIAGLKEAVTSIRNESKSTVDSMKSDEIDKQLSFDDSEYDKFDDENGKHYYGNDGLINDDLPKNEDAEVFSTTSSTKASVDKLVSTANPIENASSSATGSENTVYMTTTATAEAETTKSSDQIENETTTILAEASSVPNRDSDQESVMATQTAETTPTLNIDNLNMSEYRNLMSRFAAEHKDDLYTNSKSVARNTAPIHITLSPDHPTVVTSPNYPNNYPANIQMDWIIDGQGMGIEFNLTDCRINGNIGDYLLVIPGAANDLQTDGIIFTYIHQTERRYRFMNVNRMFVRFKTHPTFMTLTGFSFSAKLMWPPLGIVNEESIRDPEMIVDPPTETMEVSLAGLTLFQFHEVKSEFEALVADMAQAYIEDNDINPGLNTTLEVTQVTRAAICNIRWPNYGTCVDVRFGVPLQYTEALQKPRLNATDLDIMWRTYIVKEPFANRLSNLGITEYAIPNDHSILMVWLIIASGVVIATCLLGFALWRFNCFVDYTRMKAFSDSDSIQNEKRNLDLYPTPHQTLPPLYSESDYKWADGKFDDSSRVDLGGFANKSYIRDDFFDLDSDEDVIIPHDRKSAISPKDIYEV